MNTVLPENRIVAQIGIIVRDVEKSAEVFAGFFGLDVPQWIWTDGPEKSKSVYRGKPTAARAKLAFLKLGNLDIELIEPDGNPSTWREFLDSKGEGVHHIAFVIAGMKDRTHALETMGFPLVQKGEYTGGRYAYFNTVPGLKTVLELLENDE
jgi:methylmalonyl-CoA/ethylmalonyl-CoA epimerase